MSMLVARFDEFEQLEFCFTAEWLLEVCNGLLENVDCGKDDR
jgi:hypothetical protein